MDINSNVLNEIILTRITVNLERIFPHTHKQGLRKYKKYVFMLLFDKKIRLKLTRISRTRITRKPVSSHLQKILKKEKYVERHANLNKDDRIGK